MFLVVLGMLGAKCLNCFTDIYICYSTFTDPLRWQYYYPCFKGQDANGLSLGTKISYKINLLY